MGTTFGPPWGVPQRTEPLPDRGFPGDTCTDDLPDEQKLFYELTPWIYKPPGWESFDPTASIATPSVLAGITTVLTLTAPLGWDGVINAISNAFIGVGWVEASGDLTWGIFINGNQPVKNYGQITTSFGTIALPRPIAGFILRSGQSVQYKVTNTNNALTGGTKIYCGFSGYFWRRQGGTY